MLKIFSWGLIHALLMIALLPGGSVSLHAQTGSSKTKELLLNKGLLDKTVIYKTPTLPIPPPQRFALTQFRTKSHGTGKGLNAGGQQTSTACVDRRPTQSNPVDVLITYCTAIQQVPETPIGPGKPRPSSAKALVMRIRLSAVSTRPSVKVSAMPRPNPGAETFVISALTKKSI